MSFEQRLNETVELIESRLECLCADLKAQGTPDRLGRAIHHALLAGGKRFRPFLVLESAALFDLPASLALETATAIECIHCYSLAHDDLPTMDNDELRRGEPTVWAAYDEWTAILAGDALQALAFELLGDSRCHKDPQIRSRLVVNLARASGGSGMVGGQALDLEADKRTKTAQPTLAQIQSLQAMKTGALIRFSCMAGSILAGKDESEESTKALTAFGNSLGYAFQIADDLLDAEGDAQTMGKAVAKDAQAGKATLVSKLGIDEAKLRLSAVHAQALAALEYFGSKANTLRQATNFVVNRKQ